MDETYELLALRYATMQNRTRGNNFIFPDDHAALMPIDFYVFVIRGNGRTFVVDTGYEHEDARKRGRTITCLPSEILAQAGVDAASAENVILTHMHWDHAGGMNLFPRAKFHLQASEMNYCTGPCMCHGVLRNPFDVEHVVSAVRALYAGRMLFHDGVTELAPGISLHLIGGHSRGIQAVRVRTKRGWVVLAGDTTHFWANLRQRNPFPIVVDVAQMLAGFDTLERLADGPDHVIPGHDPLILTRFPRERDNPDIVRLDLPPIA